MTNVNTFQGDVFIHQYIKHTGDENNLFGFSADDTFKITTAGTDRVTVKSDGKVGIADTAPDYPLDVNGVVQSQSQFRMKFPAQSDLGGFIEGYSASGADGGMVIGGRAWNSVGSYGIHVRYNGSIGIGNYAQPPQPLSVSGMTFSTQFASNYGQAYVANGYALLYALNMTQFWIWESVNNGNNTYGLTYFRIKSNFPTRVSHLIGNNHAFEQGNYIKMSVGTGTNINFRTIRWI